LGEKVAEGRMRGQSLRLPSADALQQSHISEQLFDRGTVVDGGDRPTGVIVELHSRVYP
jgi:hypothetical protein